ncbi:MAG TPA: VOC family protein [Acidimicrobiales bacterium]|nr:VOC family protein [Acidimicrobiales bacterium]
MFNHVGQCTTDLDRATRFYVDLLGFEIERDLEVPDEAAGPLLGVDPPLNLRARYLRKGDFVLELMSFERLVRRDTPRVMNEPGLTHLSISVDDLDASVAQVPALGGEVVVVLPNAVMIRDPDGQLLELLTMEYRDMVERMKARATRDPGE